MLTKRVTAILPVVDADRAARFYGQLLGLRDLGAAGDGSRLFQAGEGSALELMVAEEGAQSRHTAVSFEVDDLAAAIRELEGRGVVFEDYDLPELKTVDHIATLGDERAAWFCDTEGNILCVHDRINGG
jgi:predicted enzyme related to lactoylglutathione lyase